MRQRAKMRPNQLKTRPASLQMKIGAQRGVTIPRRRVRKVSVTLWPVPKVTMRHRHRLPFPQCPTLMEDGEP